MKVVVWRHTFQIRSRKKIKAFDGERKNACMAKDKWWEKQIDYIYIIDLFYSRHTLRAKRKKNCTIQLAKDYAATHNEGLVSEKHQFNETIS